MAQMDELGEAFPGQEFSIEDPNSEKGHHERLLEGLQLELIVMNVMEYSANARDCMEIIINEAKSRAREAEILEQ